MENPLCESLLSQWCEKMLSLQITDNHDDGLYGGILCPACSRVHGRCFDAIYPFMYMADAHKDPRFLEAAKLLFDWAERVVSREDGSFLNDTNSSWKGITVFSVIQLAEALKYHGQLLDADTYARWKARIAKAADFLKGFAAIYDNNVNYRITNALAMQYCSELLDDPACAALAVKSAESAVDFITEEGFLFGEGRPSNGHTPRGCRAVDIGYNVEESLPSLAIYAHMTKNSRLEQEVARAMGTQLRFMLPDGGWDNSFGTRNFKWTYWGSRTSDGSALGYLLLAEYNPAFVTAARKNIELLAECTHDGLLHGGLHYHTAGERACVHHTFAHAKVLAGILDHHLVLSGAEVLLPRTQTKTAVHLSDIDTYQINRGGMLATLTCYDWEYLPGGHASGGNLSMLWHPATGPVLCATMSEYSMKEVNNMQLPRLPLHECLSPALEYLENDTRYTTLYDFEAKAKLKVNSFGDVIDVAGQLVDMEHHGPAQPLTHSTSYSFDGDRLMVTVMLNRDAGYFVCPIVAAGGQPVIWRDNMLMIDRPNARVTLTVVQGDLSLPYGDARCYNLVAGLQAVKSVIHPTDGKLIFTLEINNLLV